LLALKSDHFVDSATAPTIMQGALWYGNAILSRYPITEKVITDVSHVGREPRNILEAFLSTPGGDLHVVTTHKGLRSVERRGQIKRLHDLLVRDRQVPLVVGGDINEWHSSPRALRELNRTLHPCPVGAT